jgi:3-oxoacyl-[acyl-carrier protein] reductase
MTLKDKTVMISGAARGIGRAIAVELAREGANISFSFKKSGEEAKALEKDIRDVGSSAQAFQVEIKDFDAVKSWVEKTKEAFGTVDVVINNAGIIRDKALALMDPEDWHDVINTNLDGTFNLTRATIISLMKQKSGTIINITSVSGIVGVPRQTNYSASKAGIIGFTRSLAKEVAPYNIKVNAIAPGFIETDMLNDLKEEYLAELTKQIPFKRLGSPQDVAKAVKFLVSEDANYITGQTIAIDGGMSMV